jgi:hypothetical protein
MAHVLEIADEVYRSLVDAAHDRGTTPQQLLEEWLTALSQQAVRRNGTSDSELKPHDRSIEQPDPWRGFVGAAEATDPDVLERHDHYLAEEYADTTTSIDDPVC